VEVEEGKALPGNCNFRTDSYKFPTEEMLEISILPQTAAGCAAGRASASYLAELMQLDVYGSTQPGAEVTRTSTDEAETLAPRKLMTLLLHRSLNLHAQIDRQTNSYVPSSSFAVRSSDIQTH